MAKLHVIPKDMFTFDVDIHEHENPRTKFLDETPRLRSEIAEIVTREFGHEIKHGDVIWIESHHDQGYRNEGKLIWNGKTNKCKSLDRLIDEYGSIPKMFKVLDEEFNYPVGHWADVIEHNCIIWPDFKNRNMVWNDVEYITDVESKEAVAATRSFKLDEQLYHVVIQITSSDERNRCSVEEATNYLRKLKRSPTGFGKLFFVLEDEDIDLDLTEARRKIAGNHRWHKLVGYYERVKHELFGPNSVIIYAKLRH